VYAQATTTSMWLFVGSTYSWILLLLNQKCLVPLSTHCHIWFFTMFSFSVFFNYLIMCLVHNHQVLKEIIFQ
jgi:hypothetical protein